MEGIKYKPVVVLIGWRLPLTKVMTPATTGTPIKISGLTNAGSILTTPELTCRFAHHRKPVIAGDTARGSMTGVVMSGI